ncbi:hypothetical protein D3C80_1789460 [compost metagenome]
MLINDRHVSDRLNVTIDITEPSLLTQLLDDLSQYTLRRTGLLVIVQRLTHVEEVESKEVTHLEFAAPNILEHVFVEGTGSPETIHVLEEQHRTDTFHYDEITGSGHVH